MRLRLRIGPESTGESAQGSQRYLLRKARCIRDCVSDPANGRVRQKSTRAARRVRLGASPARMPLNTLRAVLVHGPQGSSKGACAPFAANAPGLAPPPPPRPRSLAAFRKPEKRLAMLAGEEISILPNSRDACLRQSAVFAEESPVRWAYGSDITSGRVRKKVESAKAVSGIC